MEKTKETNAMCDVMIFICTTNYDGKHLQVNKNTKKIFKGFSFHLGYQIFKFFWLYLDII